MRRALTVVLAFAVFGAGSTAAHDARPLAITLVEQTPGVYRAVVRVPPSLAPAQVPTILWPSQCRMPESSVDRALSEVQRSISLLECPDGLAGLTLGVVYSPFNPSISTLIRLERFDGESVTALLPPDTLQWQVPAQPGWLGVAWNYTKLGFTHIREGPDHLLFVAGLLILAALPGRIVLAVTGFTAAHSITLALATLGLIRVPVGPTEALIALSILFLAAEIARDGSTSLGRRYPVALSFTFGLLHGFGFAGALGDIGLPQGALITGLLFFNVGVELGQLAFIAVAAGLFATVYRLGTFGRRDVDSASEGRFGSGMPELRRSIAVPVAWLLGVPAAYWFIERTVRAFTVI